MKIEEKISLKQYTGFQIGGPASYFGVAHSIVDIEAGVKFAKSKQVQVLVLGSGTNMVVSDAGFDGLVIKIELGGVEIKENGDNVFITAQAGESWDQLVNLCAEKEYWGIENLSHIPGTVGGFVVQNVGAYGQEASQVVDSVQVFDTATNTLGTLTAEDCYFSYRQSIFNSVMQGRFIVLAVKLKLSRIPKPNLSYADVHRYFNPGCSDHSAHNHERLIPELKEIRQAIIEIRNKKFTTPDVTPNAGSFFKNLLLHEQQYQILETHIKENFGDEALKKLLGYYNRLSGQQQIKIPTAFLIDLCGLKGSVVGGAKINETQPLVILNYERTATSDDVLNLMKLVRKAVKSKTGMEIVPEPELIGFSAQELEEYFRLD